MARDPGSRKRHATILHGRRKVAAGRTFRAAFRRHLAALLGTDGVLVMPTMPDVAPLRSESESALEDYRKEPQFA